MRGHAPVGLGAACAMVIITILLAMRSTPDKRHPVHTPRHEPAAFGVSHPEKSCAVPSRQGAAGAYAPGVDASKKQKEPLPEATSIAPVLGVTVVEPAAPVELRALYARLGRRARAIENDSLLRTQKAEEYRNTPLTRFSEEDVAEQLWLADMQAKAQLARLSASYRLNASQRELIYRALVPTTPAYHPDMEVVSASGTAKDDGSRAASDSRPATVVETARVADEQIHAVLEQGQKAAYEDDWVDRDLWWSEIIGQLSDDLDADLAAAAAADDGGTGHAESTGIPEEHVGANLFDLLNP